MSSKVKQANFRLPLEYMSMIDDFASRENITKAAVITRALDCMQASYDSGNGGMPVTGSGSGASEQEINDLKNQLKQAEERRAAGYFGAGLRAEPCRHEEDSLRRGPAERFKNALCFALGILIGSLFYFLCSGNDCGRFQNTLSPEKLYRKTTFSKTAALSGFGPHAKPRIV